MELVVYAVVEDAFGWATDEEEVGGRCVLQAVQGTSGKHGALVLVRGPVRLLASAGAIACPLALAASQQLGLLTEASRADAAPLGRQRHGRVGWRREA